MERRRPQAVAPFATPVSVDDDALASIPRSYVLTLQDHSIPPALQRRMIAEHPCGRVIELDTDHAPYLLRDGRAGRGADRARRLATVAFCRHEPSAYSVRATSAYGTGLTIARISTWRWRSTTGFAEPPFSSPQTSVTSVPISTSELTTPSESIERSL